MTNVPHSTAEQIDEIFEEHLKDMAALSETVRSVHKVASDNAKAKLLQIMADERIDELENIPGERINNREYAVEQKYLIDRIAQLKSSRAEEKTE